MRRFIVGLLLLSGLLVLLYYGPFFKYRWLFSVLLELWPYLCVFPLLSFLLLLWRPHSIQLGIAALLLILSGSPVLTWVGLPDFRPTPEGVTVMSYNLWIDNPNADAIEQSILGEDPDILFLSEVSQPMMAELRSHLSYPYDYRTDGSNSALFSRYPFVEATTEDFGVKTRGRTFSLVAKLQLEQEIVTVIGVHPPVPIIKSFFHIRNQQLETFAQASRDVAGKMIVLGDFNSTPWSPYFQRFERQSQLQNAGRGQWIWATWYFNQ
ncbi:MAG: endonuclease/exonuclease/phosphatase family protein, partial [Cyanobacteria bacterium P01_A01_bin.17]